MDTETHTTTSEDSQHFLPRQQEIASLMEALPLRGFDERSKRVFNIWGENGVGKTTFLSEFRECEEMQEQKALWLSPTRDGDVDSIREFIVSCSKAVRFPSEPEKEKRIAERIERVQSGKINLMESDDSILIARPTVVENEKPYINKAAAASVGRTEHKRADIQVSVGFGENKASNQAEGFLDSLPLQSMGANFIILYISDADRLAQSVKDWLREWVVPTASKGPYRRNLIIFSEAGEPSELHSPQDQWGDWQDRSFDFRVHPLSVHDVTEFGTRAKLDRAACRMLYTETLGYPNQLLDTAQRISQISSSNPHSAFEAIAATLDEDGSAKLAACCLPSILHPSELDAIFGYQKGIGVFDWLTKLPHIPITQDSKTKGFKIDERFRRDALESNLDSPIYKSYETDYLAYGRLCRNVPSQPCRNKLYLLSSLNWIEGIFCDALFGNASEKVFHFIANSERLFVRKNDHYHISERIRSDLAKTADRMSHIGMGSIRDKAVQLWTDRRNQIETTILDLERAYKIAIERADKLSRKQQETNAYLRVVEKKEPTAESVAPKPIRVNPTQKSNGPTIAILSGIGIAGIGAAFVLGENLQTIAAGSGAIALLIAAIIFPGWLRLRQAKQFANQRFAPDSADFLRRESSNLLHSLQAEEVAIDDLKRDLERAKLQLEYSLI